MSIRAVGAQICARAPGAWLRLLTVAIPLAGAAAAVMHSIVNMDLYWLAERRTWDRAIAEPSRRPCDNQGMTKPELHQLVDRLPEGAVDGAAIILGEISNGQIDPEQAWYWKREWQAKEREADDDRATARVWRYESDEDFLMALDERTKPLDADA